jgi:hypothetical protein
MTTFTTEDREASEIDWKQKYDKLLEEYRQLQDVFDRALNAWAKESERQQK